MVIKLFWQQRYNGQPGTELTEIYKLAKEVVASYAPKKCRYFQIKCSAEVISFFRGLKPLAQSRQYKKRLQPLRFLAHYGA